MVMESSAMLHIIQTYLCIKEHHVISHGECPFDFDSKNNINLIK